MRFTDRLRRFFYGRYGIDALYYALFVSFLLIWVVRIFVKSIAADIILYLIEAALIIFMIYRVFSRNITARRRENEWFLGIFRSIRNFFILQKNRLRDIKKLRYRRCPGCGAILRLPPKKGTHTAKCPRCKKEFRVRVII